MSNNEWIVVGKKKKQENSKDSSKIISKNNQKEDTKRKSEASKTQKKSEKPIEIFKESKESKKSIKTDREISPQQVNIRTTKLVPFKDFVDNIDKDAPVVKESVDYHKSIKSSNRILDAEDILKLYGEETCKQIVSAFVLRLSTLDKIKKKGCNCLYIQLYIPDKYADLNPNRSEIHIVDLFIHQSMANPTRFEQNCMKALNITYKYYSNNIKPYGTAYGKR